MKSQIPNRHTCSLFVRCHGFDHTLRVSLAVVFALLSMVGSMFGQESPRVLAGSTPGVVAQGKDIGPEDPEKQIEITVVLQRRNEPGFQQVLQQLYTPGSPIFSPMADNGTIRRKLCAQPCRCENRQ